MVLQIEDFPSLAHLVLGTTAWSSSFYVLVYKWLIFGEKLGLLTKMWLSYLLTQSVKCGMFDFLFFVYQDNTMLYIKHTYK